MMPFLHQKFVGKERRIFCRMFGAFGFDYAKSDSQIFIFMVQEFSGGYDLLFKFCNSLGMGYANGCSLYFLFFWPWCAL